MNNVKNLNAKVISISLVIILIFTCGFLYTPVNATSDIPESSLEELLTENELTSVENSDNLTAEGLDDTLLLLDTCGININDAEVSEDTLTLDATVADIDNTIVVNIANGETIEMEAFEGNKHNTIVIDDTNTLYIDGEIVEVTEEESIDVDEVVADAQARYGSCPYGKAADYTYYVKTTTRNIKLANKIASYTATALGAIIGSSLGLAGAVAGGIAADIIKEAVSSDGKIVKAKAKIYYHKSKKTFMVTSSIGCQKEVTSFYGSNANKVLAKKTLWLYNHVNGS